MSCVRNIFFIFLFTISCLSAQESVDVLKEHVFSLMQDGTTSKNKKKARQFFRILGSDNFSSELSFQAKLVLLNFQERNLGFHNHYLNFFDLVIECKNRQKEKLLLNSVLGFLITHSSSLSDVELKKFLKSVNSFLKFQILNQKDAFSWQYVGEFSFLVNNDLRPVFYFSKADILLLNNVDTVRLVNTKGSYDILSHQFNGIYAETYFQDEGVFFDFSLNNFSIDLRKKFFQIDDAVIVSKGAVNLECEGTYKNRLTSSEKYPVFKSNSHSISIEIFNHLNIVSGFEVKGSRFLFSGKNHIDLQIQDDSVDYIIAANDFELKMGVISAPSSRFVITNNSDSIYHPLVKFSYDDDEQKIHIERLSGKRGLNPIRNTFHGLNIFADKLEIDLVYDNCLLFHYAPGRDIEVLFESDNYFDKRRYDDFFRFDLNLFGLLFSFLETQNDNLELINYNQEYLIKDFAVFSGLTFGDAWNVLIDFEIFGLLDCYRFGSFFKVKPWAFNFMASTNNQYDYDVLKIESLAAIGDTVAEIDLYLNTMDIYRVHKINLTNRFPVDFYPMSNKIQFFKNKSFYMDGNIHVGNFAFSGKDVKFDYNDFAFHFGANAILSFLRPDIQAISSSLIHFDEGTLFLDSVNNKSGIESLNNFPKFINRNHSFLSYNNDPVQFLLNPLEISYLHDVSLNNLFLPGNLYLDGDSINASGVLTFDKEHNLETVILQDSVDLYNKKIKLEQASLELSHRGLFASGYFLSDDLIFSTNNIELLSGKIIGKVVELTNGPAINTTPFRAQSVLLHYSPYDSNFLIKTASRDIKLYDLYNFNGDLYFDGENLNGSGDLMEDLFSVQSSHHYFSYNHIMSADASFVIYDQSNKNAVQFMSEGVSLEHEIDNNNFIISKSTSAFSLPLLHHLLDFDVAVYEAENHQIYFNNYNFLDEGGFTSLKYGKPSFFYRASNAEYNLVNHQLCISDNVQLKIKKFRIEPQNDAFCLLENGDFPIFKRANLIKKRWLLKDKTISGKDIVLGPSLKHGIIND